jgi:MFS family permease
MSPLSKTTSSRLPIGFAATQKQHYAFPHAPLYARAGGQRHAAKDRRALGCADATIPIRVPAASSTLSRSMSPRLTCSYLIGEIVVSPLTDYLSRVFSFRRYMIASAALFAIFSVACAFTHDLPSMIAMRGLQGFAGGVLIPMAFTLVLTKLPKSQQPVGLAIFALSVTFAPAIGPTIGGYLTENYGWRTIFFVNVIPTTVMVSALYLTLERQPMPLKLLKEGD